MYGEPIDGNTPLDPDEADGLIPTHIETRGELNEWEQANIARAMNWIATRRGNSSAVSVEFLRELHQRMFERDATPFTWGSATLHARADSRIRYIEALRSADHGNYEALLSFVRT